MGLGKILGFAALGVAAVAAAPFTGGGSVLGAASLAASLSGAGAVAAATGAGLAGAGIGAAMSEAEKEEERRKERKITELTLKADKYERAYKEALNRFKGDKEYFYYIIATTAIGISVANADGEISPEEIREINEFVGGIANSKYPQHIKETIKKLVDTPPSFNEAMEYLKKVDKKNRESIRALIEVVMEADEKIDQKEVDFLNAYDRREPEIEYVGEKVDNNTQFLADARKRFEI